MEKTLFGVKSFGNVDKTTQIAKESYGGEDKDDNVVLDQSFHFGQVVFTTNGEEQLVTNELNLRAQRVSIMLSFSVLRGAYNNEVQA